jgi:hypothetical protein
MREVRPKKSRRAGMEPTPSTGTAGGLGASQYQSTCPRHSAPQQDSAKSTATRRAPSFPQGDHVDAGFLMLMALSLILITVGIFYVVKPRAVARIRVRNTVKDPENAEPADGLVAQFGCMGAVAIAIGIILFVFGLYSLPDTGGVEEDEEPAPGPDLDLREYPDEPDVFPSDG